MDKLPYVENYQELLVYKKSRQLSQEIYELSKGFPAEEVYSLTSQIRRSSRSVGAQIAEAWAKRLYKKHFISKLSDADAELNETEHWIIIANNCGYIENTDKQLIVQTCHEIGRMLGGMIVKADLFCNGNSKN